MDITLRYGREGLKVNLPDANVSQVLRMNDLPVLTDPVSALGEALRHPINSPPLDDLARAGRSTGGGPPRRAVIVVSDLTRPVPNALLLPPLLQCLRGAGLAAEDIPHPGRHRPAPRQHGGGVDGDARGGSHAQWLPD